MGRRQDIVFIAVVIRRFCHIDDRSRGFQRPSFGTTPGGKGYDNKPRYKQFPPGSGKPYAKGGKFGGYGGKFGGYGKGKGKGDKGKHLDAYAGDLAEDESFDDDEEQLYQEDEYEYDARRATTSMTTTSGRRSPRTRTSRAQEKVKARAKAARKVRSRRKALAQNAA